MMKIELKRENCVGCGLCEIYCVVAHSPSREIIKAFKGKEERAEARLFLEINKPVSFPLQCQHCEDAPCVKGCITGAMYKNEKGVTLLNKEKCVSCYTCILECPFGAIKISKKGSPLPLKCDLCLEAGGEPYCVNNCPNGALILKGGSRDE
ncbi:MAG: 4Fe-4S dicluster domain-containing protein [Candidatus Syntrophonatronum acetioxidans]|uniref:4Fe-4S dicluster domain-containing protein n=1 Tax=Candidatus Syntrophonatronum acetioxidans TaxID=1795816 RepID=A0A424YI66_9FIRM|nr:MAG: 4Fe-4S dicluster domain-containing protein [Candidatus Syntrophonatronum acetioxidans]